MPNVTWDSFTQEASPALTDHLVGYRNTLTGGERRTLLSALLALYQANTTPAQIGAATAAQGALADSAVQLGDNITDLTNNAGFITGIAWGALTGTLSNQTDLQNALNAKQDSLTTGNLTTTGPLAVSASRQVIGGAVDVSIADAAADGATKGAAAFTASDFNSSSGVISIDYTNGQAASSSTKGFLTSTDWTTFNGKVSTGAITGSGLTMATARILGRTTATTGAIEEITVGTGLTLSGGSLTNAGVTSLAGTDEEISASAATGSVTLSLPSSLTFTGKTITGGTYVSGAFNGTLGATTPGAITATTLATSGQASLGGTTANLTRVVVGGTLTGSTLAYGTYNNAIAASDVTSLLAGHQTALSTAAAAFTLTSLTHFRAVQGTVGAGSTVTNQYGFHATNTLTGGTNNFGFYGDIAAGSNRWNLHMAGTAQNYLRGNTGIGKTPTTTSPLCLSGLPTSAAGLATGDVWSNGGVLTIV